MKNCIFFHDILNDQILKKIISVLDFVDKHIRGNLAKNPAIFKNPP